MNNIELNYYIDLGLKTFGEVKDFLTLRQNHSAQEATKIITMQRGDLEVKPISVADMDMRYNFLLNLVGNAWAVQNRETEKWLLPNGEEVGRYRTFGSNKRDAYELIKQKMEKES